MPTFAIFRSSSVLCSWDTESAISSPGSRALVRENVLILEEAEKLSFVLDAPVDGLEYRISIGDMPLDEILPNPQGAGGMVIGGRTFWPEFKYFESARGQTSIILESRYDQSPSETWVRVFIDNVYILPSKIGEDSYQSMSNDLEEVSRSLLIDLYGKSKQTHDLRYAKEGHKYHSRDHELSAIERVIEHLGLILDSIMHRPSSRIKTVLWCQNYWGGERLNPTSVAALSRHGINPMSGQRPLLIHTNRRFESFDIPEHRVVKAFLNILIRRAHYCAAVAKRHIRAISEEQPLRDVRIGDGPTIYESVDLPKIRRLQQAMQKADRSVSLISALSSLPFLNEVPPELIALKGGAFQRSREYEELLGIIRRFLLENAIWYEGSDMTEVTKLTSRLYEQWCYLQIVEAFRKCGLDLREWNDAISDNLQSRFVIDFDRGLLFEGALGSNLRIRFRYEPWILGEKTAVQSHETLCRGSAGEVAWCPDIVIECLMREADTWRPVYGIVMDCKYSKNINDHHWAQTAKYLEIRSVATRRQIIKQLWLVAPGSLSDVRSEDPAVSFGLSGPSCAPDEAVRFRLIVSPGMADQEEKYDGDDQRNPFILFAKGTINYFRKHYSAKAEIL